MVEEINRIAVIGAGLMGKQIAAKSALYGYDINVYDTNLEGLTELIDDIRKKLKKEEKTNEIKICNTLVEAVNNADLVIEAIPEKLELKKDIFAQIDKLAPPHTIIATNSSSIPISKIEGAVNRKEKVLNIHFYHLTDSPMADIMRGTHTSDLTFELGKKWIESIDITPLVVKKECYGFVFNRIWRAIKKDCLKIWAGGHADIETVDKAWRIFTGMEIGPFRMMDGVGLDVVYDIEMSYYKESGDPNDKPPQALKEMVDRGELGVKTGKGFYDYRSK